MQPLEHPATSQPDQIERPELAPDASDLRALRQALRSHPRTAQQRAEALSTALAFVVALLAHAGFLTAAALAPEPDHAELRFKAKRRLLDTLRVEQVQVARSEPLDLEVPPPAPPPAPAPPAEVTVAAPEPAPAPPPEPKPEPEPKPKVAQAEPPRPAKPPRRGKPKRVRAHTDTPLVARTEDPAAPGAAEAPTEPDRTAGLATPDGAPDGDGGSPDGVADGTGAPEGARVGDAGGSGTGDGVGPRPSIDARLLLKQYIRQVSKALRRDFDYPRAAVRQGLQGTVVLELTIDEQGHVRESRVARSSGHAVLDEAALQAVRKVTRVPRPPAELEWKQRAVQVPFHYKLG